MTGDGARNAVPDTVVLIAGPTASGKSALALDLARRLEGVVINADSMQIYADLRILTARPTAEDEARQPHALYGFVDGGERFSVGRYLEAARGALADCAQARRAAIFVGGTGLYLRALSEGLSPMPSLSEEARADAASALEQCGAEHLHQRLDERDPQTAALVPPTDRQRLIRAWALLEATGKGLSHWQSVPGVPVVPASSRKIVLDAPRPWLWQRAEERFRRMLTDGGVEEVTALLGRRLDPTLPAMKAVGVREIAGWIGGEWDKDEARRRGEAATRQYIKRQLTWFRHQMADWVRLAADDPTGMQRFVVNHSWAHH